MSPLKQVCLLMAKIEEGENNNIQKADSWRYRSENGKERNYWICTITNSIQDDWSSLSDAGYFNSLVWKQPIVLNQKFQVKELQQNKYE